MQALEDSASPSGAAPARGRAPLLLAVFAGAALALAAAGCGNREAVHPALRLTADDVNFAAERGRSIAASGGDPYQVFSTSTKTLMITVSAGMVVREAGICWPADEVAFEVAKSGAQTEADARIAARQAARTAERELRFWIVAEVPKGRDPTDVQFSLTTNTGAEYPPLAVQPPQYLRDVASVLGSTETGAGLYSYDIRFSIRGGPGYPAIGPNVSTLSLVVKQGPLSAAIPFSMPITSKSGRSPRKYGP
jgi:hypothetical protein